MAKWVVVIAEFYCRCSHNYCIKKKNILFSATFIFIYITDESYDSCENTRENLYLSGRQTGQQRQKTEKKLSDKAAGKVFKKVQHKQPSVRNYNMKDDGSVR